MTDKDDIDKTRAPDDGPDQPEIDATIAPPKSDGTFRDGLETKLSDGPGSVLRSFDQTFDSVPRVVLPEAGEIDDASQAHRPVETPSPKPESRYEVEGEIARGGMGAILKGRDTDLGRDLAIKVLLDGHKERPEVISRFIEEAQIGGQLQHPGIAPVYELGQFADQRPFFTMKLVKGKTLAELLAERADPGEDRGKFLGIFEQICQTMAYAHSRGVIHRDLKPDNVMVGAFGEVQVMDWGLAKVLTEENEKDEAIVRETLDETGALRTFRSEDSNSPDQSARTMAGSVMGTPAYMPPEQAQGKIAELDERADVFGLGAIMSVILTGKPPYVGSEVSQVFRQAFAGELDGCLARLSQSNADEELHEIAQKCLATDPALRFRDAGELTKKITDYLQSVEQRLQQAELDRIEANTKVAEERKRRRVLMALAASVLVTLSVVGGGWIWIQQKDAALAAAESKQELDELIRSRQEADEKFRLENQVNDALTVAASMERKLDATDGPRDPLQLTSASESVRRAQSLLETGEVDSGLVDRVHNLGTKLKHAVRNQQLLTALDEAFSWEMDKLAEQKVGDQQKAIVAPVDGKVAVTDELEMPIIPEASHVYRKAFQTWGLDPETTPVDEAIELINAQPDWVQQHMVVSLHRWQQSLTTYEQLKGSNWIVPEPVAMESSGGATLTLQDDGSIFVSGERVDDDVYTIRFPMEQPVAAIRLEFIPDQRLPKGGSGRGDSGNFLLGEFEVAVSDSQDGQGEHRLSIAKAEALANQNGTIDRTIDDAPATSWGIYPQIKTRHLVYYELVEEQVQDKNKYLQLRLLTGDRDRDGTLWKHHGPGRFRISIASEMSSMTKRWCESVIEGTETDPWRQALRREIATADVPALIRRARSPEIADQPRIVRSQLATAMRLAKDSHERLGEQIAQANWTTLIPESLTSKKGTTLTNQSDGSILASGIAPPSDSYRLRMKVDFANLTAVRLETLPDASLPDGGSGREKGYGNFHLHGFRAKLIDNKGDERQLGFSNAVADYHNNVADIGSVFTSDRYDYWTPYGQHKSLRYAVFFTDAFPRDGSVTELIVDIDSGLDSGRTLGRFRISVTSSPIKTVQHETVELLQRIQREHPDDYWTNYSLAMMLTEYGTERFEEALHHASLALSRRPDSPLSHAAMRRALQPRNLRIDDPLVDLVVYHAHRQWELGLVNGDLLSLWEYYFFNGNGHRNRGMKHKAIAFYRRATQIYPGGVRPWKEMAKLLFSRKQFDEAAEAYRQLASINPKNAIFQRRLGESLVKAGRPDEAIPAFRALVTIRPDKLEYRLPLGQALASAGKMEEAIQNAKGMVQKKPDSFDYQFSLGQLLEQAEEFAEAKEVYLATSSIAPRDYRPHEQLGRMALAQGEYDDAEKHFSRVAELATRQGLLNNIAWSLVETPTETGTAQQAVKLATRSFELFPNSWQVRHTLGVAQYRAENWQEAVDALQKSMELHDGGNCLEWFFLAMAKWQLGEHEEARRLFEKSVTWMDEHIPDDTDAHRLRAEAEKLIKIEC